MKKTTLLLGSVCCFALNSGAFAEEISPTDTQGLSFGSILSTMNVGGGSNIAQWQVAPTYSELFGLGVRATVGTYVTDDFALGAIIDIGEYREEYLANAGVRINDNMRVIGSVGILKESEEFTLGDGREDVSQLEYGLSLKGNYEAGFVRGFEVNAYHTNGSADTDAVETGDLTGLQVVTQLKPAQSTDIRLGAGYEKAEWDGGDVDEGFTLQTLGSQRLSDTLALNFEAKSAETENVYGLGLTYDMSTPEVQNSELSVDLMRIEGKHGISDDTRVAVNWTVGFGAGGATSSDATVSSMGSIARADLLADVMKRPAFLPERVLARAGVSAVCRTYEQAKTLYFLLDDGRDDYALLSVNLLEAEDIQVFVGGEPNTDYIVNAYQGTESSLDWEENGPLVYNSGIEVLVRYTLNGVCYETSYSEVSKS